VFHGPYLNSFLCILGKLGHGDTNRQYKPKIIEAFMGLYIRKVACTSQCSMALTSTGQVMLTSLIICVLDE
jgi:E3 ubiquitin-protein ligase HERC1